MTSETPPNTSANEPELMDELHLESDENETDIAAMLLDAYDAPPVPKSLIKRLDEDIAGQWGHSPELVSARATVKYPVGSAKSFVKRSWWVAGAAAAGLMFVVLVAGGSGSYAWAAVVEAIERRGLVQINQPDGKLWLDLSKKVACRQDDQQTRWVDFGKRLVITRVKSSGKLEQSSLTLADNRLPTGDELLAVGLLGQPLSAESIERFRGVRVVGERWQKQTDQGRAVVDLQVELATRDDQRFELSLQLNPESKLPLAADSNRSPVVPGTASAPTMSLAYLDETSDLLQSRLNLNDAVMVLSKENDASVDPSTRIALAEPDVKPNPLDESEMGLSESVDPHGNRDDSKSLDRSGKASRPSEAELVASLPIGAARGWKPVAVVPRSDDEVLRRVDEILEGLWSSEQIEPVGRTGDLQLLRRAYLDIAGRTPSVTEVRNFQNDTSEDRYLRLVDRLLDSPDYASQMAAVWRSFMIPEGVDLDAFGGREAFEKWLSERFAAEEPYDQIVRKLLLAEGRLSQSGPLLFYSALKLDADQLAARTSRVFLGMRLECAQCHDHPFESWSQNDFWSYAAFFAQISRPKGKLENVSTVMRVQDVDRGEVMLPETEDVVSPRFLGESVNSDDVVIAEDLAQPLPPRRKQLAAWLTGPGNPYFARATVNRVWSHLFGRGIVDPVDDFGASNQPVSAELLDTLASQFIDSGFDLKQLVRSIAKSKAYQLSSSSDRPNDTPAETERRLKTFAQMNVKTLTAEQLYDCIAVATLLDQQNVAATDYTLARFGNTQREQFLQQFAAPSTSRSEYLAGIPQALMLMNGSLIASATGESSSGLIRSLEAPFFTDKQRIDVLFMATLSRPANNDEMELVAEYIPPDATSEQRRTGLADLLWALVNSSEFTLNH
ncbi:MAG: DUF1553 domain-containing protein [Planctomycetales bacterium]|nr:DUF1553 domain-containing protein [Planctomycetales bacterium]